MISKDVESHGNWLYLGSPEEQW